MLAGLTLQCTYNYTHSLPAFSVPKKEPHPAPYTLCAIICVKWWFCTATWMMFFIWCSVFSPEISDSIGASLRRGGSLYSDAPCRDAKRRIMSHHIQVLYTTLHHKCQCVFLYYPLWWVPVSPIQHNDESRHFIHSPLPIVTDSPVYS